MSIHVLSLISETLNDAFVIVFLFGDEMHQFWIEKLYFALKEGLGWFTKEATVHGRHRWFSATVSEAL